jgi:hypothetical protein
MIVFEIHLWVSPNQLSASSFDPATRVEVARTAFVTAWKERRRRARLVQPPFGGSLLRGADHPYGVRCFWRSQSNFLTRQQGIERIGGGSHARAMDQLRRSGTGVPKQRKGPDKIRCGALRHFDASTETETRTAERHRRDPHAIARIIY